MLVKESPDEIWGMDKNYNYFKQVAGWNMNLTFAFGVIDGEMLVSRMKGSHYDIIKKTNKKVGSGFEAREAFDFPGRIWLGQKYISFWTYPKDNAAMKKFIKELEIAFHEQSGKHVNIWDDKEYMIDINLGTNPIDPKAWDSYNEKTSQLIPLQEYKGSEDASKEDMEKEHTVSPMHKKGGKVYGGSKKKSWPKHLRPFESLQPINENPNATADPKEWEKHKDNKSYTPKPIEYNYGGAIPFAYYGPDEVFMAGSTKATHPTMMKKAYNKGLIPSRKYLIERTVNSGRVFPIVKVISFWVYPKTHSELVKVVKDIESNTKVKNILSDPEWRIEIPAGEFKSHIDKEYRPNAVNSWGSRYPRISQMNFVKIDDYKGGHTRSEEELAAPHIDTPMNKRNYKVPDGIGSHKKKWPAHMKPFESQTTDDPIKMVPESLDESIKKK